MVVNILVEIKLRKTQIHVFIKSELRIMTRIQLVIIFWDIVFRFEAIQHLIALSSYSRSCFLVFESLALTSHCCVLTVDVLDFFVPCTLLLVRFQAATQIRFDLAHRFTV